MINRLLLLCAGAFSLFSCDSSPEILNKSGKAELLATEQIPVSVTFPSLDGTRIAANWYQLSKSFPVILLCHQANSNKTEFESTALKLFEMGFNCLAIDQRSGGTFGDSLNMTRQHALAEHKLTDPLSAEQDIQAAIEFLHQKYKQKVILLGSSYSATLALYQGLENEHVRAVIAFSPANDFSGSRGDLSKLMARWNKPLFITSSRDELPEVQELLQNINTNRDIHHFRPVGKGQHGAISLAQTETDHKEYWDALVAFLNKLKEAK